jgi:hypothetical protein
MLDERQEARVEEPFMGSAIDDVGTRGIYL